MRRRVEVTVEMVCCRCWFHHWGVYPLTRPQPTPYTLLCVIGYLTVTLLVLDFRIPFLLLPFALLGTCSPRLSTPSPTDVGSGPVIPGTPVETVDRKLSLTHLESHLNISSESLRNVTPPSSLHSRKLFHIHDDDDCKSAPLVISLQILTSPVTVNGPLSRGANQNVLLTPPPTIPRRRHVSYSPQTLPTPRTERPSFRTRVSSTPSDEIRRTRKGSTNRRPVSENYDENLVPKKEVWDTSFELLLYNLSKSRSRQSSLVQPQPRFNVSSPISPLAPSPLIHSS